MTDVSDSSREVLVTAPMRRVVGTSAGLLLALALTACSGDSRASADPAPATTTASDPTPEGTTTPKIAEPAVAALDIDPSTHYQVGPEGAEAAYREVVELATVHAFDPDYFFRDGDNSAASLDAVATRLTPEQAEHLRAQADACVALVVEACGDVLGIVYFDAGSDEKPYTLRDDMEFVTEQSITNARMAGVIPDLGESYLELTFDHTAKVRFLLDGQPAVVTMTRHETYELVPNRSGTGTQWLISNWSGDYQGDLRDEATGEPVEG